MTEFYLVCDLEATDKHANNAQMLTACFILLDENFKERERKSYRIRHRFWDKAAENAVLIHKITREEANRFPPRDRILPKIVEWIEETKKLYNCNLRFVCHANRNAFGRFASYDYTVISYNLIDLDPELLFRFRLACPARLIMSTHTIAKSVLALDGFSLDKVCSNLGIELKHHDAESDAQACAAILRNLGRRYDVKSICDKEWEIGGTTRSSEPDESEEKPARNRRRSRVMPPDGDIYRAREAASPAR